MSYLDDLTRIWETVKVSFEDKFTKNIIDLWFSDLKLDSYENNIITFTTDIELKQKIVSEKYTGVIAEGFEALLGFKPEISVKYIGEESSLDKMKRQLRLSENENTKEDENTGSIQVKEDEKAFGALPKSYNFEYTFDNFIVGNSNKFAHAACIAVADRPAMDYNPLFIYGPSGLGKTHLLSAVVNKIKMKKPDTKVIYIKGDDFTNQMVESLSKHKMSDFHNKFRNCDVLLIDDIQFIAGKTSTQEEFFHTFNTLYEEHKQIILTSDRPPKDIQTLEERLRTRFEWGLLADIQPPDLELRIAIIKKKAEQVSIDIPEDVLEFLAENLRSNIRQLEGAIKKLSAQSFIYGSGITMDLAKSCLSELLGGAEPIQATIDRIFSAVERKYNVSKDDLIGRKRNREIAIPRHISIYLIREITEMPLVKIGKIFGGKDHATILSSCNKVKDMLMSDPLMAIDIEDLTKEINAG